MASQPSPSSGTRSAATPTPTPATRPASNSLSGGPQEKPSASSAKNGVTVVDFFDATPNPTQTHGEQVSNVVSQTSQSSPSIQQVQLPVSDKPGAQADPFQDIGQYAEERATTVLDGSAKALGNILSNPGQTRVVNQSLGTNPARVIGTVLTELGKENAERRAQGLEENGGPKANQLKQQFGYPPDKKVDGKELFQQVVNRVESEFANNPAIAASRQRYEEQTQKLENAGILNVVAAGNEGETVRDLKEAGISFSDGFSRNVLANNQAITVGATNGDQHSDFSVENDAVDIAAQGEQVPVGQGQTNNGTSFAAPQVAATLSDIFAANPNLTNAQARDILYQSAHDTPLTSQQEGHGTLDPNKARMLAALSAMDVQPASV